MIHRHIYKVATMNTAYFRDTKRQFKHAIQEVLRTAPATYEEKEAALPAYAHRNPFIDMLFWGRLRAAARMFDASSSVDGPRRVLDFGCGTGIMTQYLSLCGHEVVGTDLTFEPLNKIRHQIPFSPSCSFVLTDKLDNEVAHTYDCIIALDVLEHIESLDATIETFRRLLKVGGAMIISGPTENVLYHIGRTFAGSEFSGEYHVTNIHDIEKRFAQECTFDERHTLYPLFPLFTVFRCRFR